MSRSELIKTPGDARAARGELTGWATTRRNLRLHDAIAKKYLSARLLCTRYLHAMYQVTYPPSTDRSPARVRPYQLLPPKPP